MSRNLEVEEELVRARLRALESLLTDLDTQFPQLRTVRQRQGQAMWTDIPDCRDFGYNYDRLLGKLEYALGGIRARIAELQVNLAASAESLARTDQDVQDRLAALAARLADGPPGGSIAPPDPPAAPTGGSGW